MAGERMLVPISDLTATSEKLAAIGAATAPGIDA